MRTESCLPCSFVILHAGSPSIFGTQRRAPGPISGSRSLWGCDSISCPPIPADLSYTRITREPIWLSIGSSQGGNGKTSRQFGTALGNRVCTCYLRDDRKGLGRCVSRVSRWRWRAHSLVTSGNFQIFGSSRTRPRPPLRSPSLAAVELHRSYPFLRHMTFGIHLCFGLA